MVRLKASYAGLICRTHQYYYHRQWLSNEWSKLRKISIRRGYMAMDWSERFWEKELIKTKVENVTNYVFCFLVQLLEKLTNLHEKMKRRHYSRVNIDYEFFF